MRMTGKVKGETFLKNIVQFEPIYCFLNKALGKHFEYSVLASENWEELNKIWLYWFDAIEVSEQKNFWKNEILFTKSRGRLHDRQVSSSLPKIDFLSC